MADLAEQLLDQEEGMSSPVVYYVAGVAHIGRGVCVDKNIAGAGLPQSILRELDAFSLSKAKLLASLLPGFEQCNPVRQAVLVSMCYQMGTLALWPHFKAALLAGDYALAADNMLYQDGSNPTSGPSDWRKQTPARCQREALMMRTGEWVEEA